MVFYIMAKYIKLGRFYVLEKFIDVGARERIAPERSNPHIGTYLAKLSLIHLLYREVFQITRSEDAQRFR